MGYYVILNESDVILPKEHHNEILSRWHEMNSSKYDKDKRGGRYSGGKTTATWYSWMPEKYEQNTSSPQEVLELLGFSFSEQENGDLLIDGYNSKTGQEDLFFKKISDLIKPNTLMQWSGEDGETYCWFFNGSLLQEVDMREGFKLQREFEELLPVVEVQAQHVIEKAQLSSKPPKKKNRYNL